MISKLFETGVVIVVIVLIALLLVSRSEAKDMTKDDYMLEASWQFLNVIDWRQTRVIVGDSRFQEGGLILSKDPDKEEVDVYFITMALVHFAGVNLLERKWKRTAQILMLGIKTGTVYRNYYVGVRFGW